MEIIGWWFDCSTGVKIEKKMKRDTKIEDMKIEERVWNMSISDEFINEFYDDFKKAELDLLEEIKRIEDSYEVVVDIRKTYGSMYQIRAIPKHNADDEAIRRALHSIESNLI